MTTNGAQSRRGFLRACGPAAALAVGANAVRGDTAAPGRVSSRKDLAYLRAKVIEGRVQLTVYKSTPTLKDAAAQERFGKIRVYRREEPGFVFGEDYAEYFDGLSHRDAELVFEGPLEAANERKFSYQDDTAQVGSTYAYWMAPLEGPPTGPVAVKVRDPEVWWSPERIDRETAALAEQHPKLVAVDIIGSTVRGEKLKAIRVGKAEPCIALIGALHAGESGPELMMPALAAVLDGHKELLEKVSITAVAAVNLDERRRLAEGVPWYLRTNANRVDLNRNYPADWEGVDYGYGLITSDPDSMTYRGPEPSSEPETTAVMELLRSRPVETLFSFHCLASICGSRLLGPKCAAKDAPYKARCIELADTFCLGMDPANKPGAGFVFGTSSGSLPAWCYRELKIPAFDIEISSRETKALAKCRVDRTDRPLLEEYQERHAAALLALIDMFQPR